MVEIQQLAGTDELTQLNSRQSIRTIVEGRNDKEDTLLGNRFEILEKKNL